MIKQVVLEVVLAVICAIVLIAAASAGEDQNGANSAAARTDWISILRLAKHGPDFRSTIIVGQ